MDSRTPTERELFPPPNVVSVEIGVLTTRKHVVPVSYTHLRAHETVLDLVCRLLLEKNTNNSQHTLRYVNINKDQQHTLQDTH